jgi:tetratricopeptide (TPR) repeat protein
VSVDLLGEARRRLDAGHPASARGLAEQALEIGRAAGISAAVAPAARVLAECLYAVGEIEGARALADEAYRLDEQTGDAGALGADLNLIGILELTVGRQPEAIALLRRSLEIRTGALGPDHEDTIESLNNLGVAMWRMGAEDEALAVHEEALARCERALGETHRRTAETLNSLAVKLASRPGSQARSRELYERGLGAAEAALGPDSDLVARLSANVATAWIDADELERARPMVERALQLHELHFGPNSRWTAYVLDTRANLASLQGRYADARTDFERMLVIRMDELGPTDPETLDAAAGLQVALSDLAAEDPNAMDEGMGLYLPLATLRGGAHAGPFAPSGLPSPDVAVAQLRAFVDRLRERTAPDPTQLYAIARAEELADAADAAHLAGNLPRAAELLEEQIALLEAARGGSHPTLVEPLRRLVLVRRVGGTESPTLGLLRRVARVLTDAYGEMHPLAIGALVDVYRQERREFGPAGGRETSARMAALSRAALGEESPIAKLVTEAVMTGVPSTDEGVEPELEALSAVRERELAAPNPLADELLADLGDERWIELRHAYGRAVDTPRHLRLLLAADDRVRGDALDLLGESLLHQETVYPATTPAVMRIRRLALDSRVPGRDRLVAFLTASWIAARDGGGEHVDGLRRTVADVPVLLARLAASDPDVVVREAASFGLGITGSGSDAH